MFNRTSRCEHRARPRPPYLTTAARAAVVALGLAASFPALPTDLSSVPLPTYTVGSTVDVKPNILFVLDDSGSMDWDFLPDWVTLSRPSSTDYTINYTSVPPYLSANASFNGVAYNPAVTYSPPVTFTSAGTKTSFASMTGMSTTAGGDSSATASSPNWNAVKYDAYGVQAADASNVFTPPRTSTGATTHKLTDNAFYYTIIPGEYCSTPSLTSCTAATAASTGFQYPAALRWCSSATLATANCKALPDGTYQYPRIAAPLVSTITIPGTGGSNRTINTITIGGQQIMSAATTASSIAADIATGVANAINACATAITGSCTIAGYTAYSAPTSSVVTIYAPGIVSGAPTATTSSGSYTTSVNNAFSSFAAPKIPVAQYLSGTTQSSAGVPGYNVRTVITSSNDSYPYPGTTAKAGTRTDCAGTTCTYKEEMTNYANWWAYYHTRMQMMKSAASLAFSTLDSDANIATGNTRYRVGYFSLNNNTTTDMVNVTDFNANGKFTWYSKFLKAKPSNGTALRQALSDAGRLYAGALNGTTYNGVKVTEPMQYSCQRNYTILSTDGFWNGGAGYKLDGLTAIGNQDGALPRPYKDGASSTVQQSTSQLQTRTDTQVAQKGTLQMQVSQLQIMTSQLQSRTDQLQKRTDQLQKKTDQLQAKVDQLQAKVDQLTKRVDQLFKRTDQLQTRTSNNGGNTFTAWSPAQTCTPDTTTNSRRDCQTVTLTDVAVTSCTAGTVSNATVGLETITCHTVTTVTNVASCTASSTAGTTTTCPIATGTFTNVASCTAGTVNGATTTCQTVPGTFTNATSCTAGTVNGATTTCQTVPGTFANATSCTAGTVGGVTTTCQTVQGTFANATSCTAGTTNGVTTVCQTVTGTFANAATCTAGTTLGVTTSCQYVDSAWTSAGSSCTALPKSTGPSYTVGVARACQTVVTSPFTNAASCTATTTPNSSGNTTQCQYTFAASAATSTCSPAYTAGNFTNQTVYANCGSTPGPAWTNVSTCTIGSPGTNGQFTNCQYDAWTAYATVPSCTPVSQSTGPSFDVAKGVQCKTLVSGGTSDTLSDVAAYYYNTDLRSASATGANATGGCTAADGTTDLCANNVIPYGRDTATWQHMTVHTLGLGAQGQMVFSPYQNNAAGERVYVPDYWTQPSGDFFAVANGSTATSTICTWMSSGTCTWPVPVSDTITNIDDLWHTAVDGHGTYFSATDPASLSTALSNVLAQIVNTPRPGTAAAAASSNPNITSSDNFVFSSSYQSVTWFGELIMQRFNDDGTLSDQQWSAMRLLDCATTPWQAATTYAVGQVYNQGGTCYLVNNAYTSGNAFAGGSGGTDAVAVTALSGAPVTRKILMAKSGGLVPFTWANLTTAQQAYFTAPNLTYVSATSGLSQFCSTGGACLSSAAQTSASGSALIDYLSGVRTNEVTYYRARTHVLGDIVSSEARYVKLPVQAYVDTNYAAFVSSQTSRLPTVYVGANDGMLHAFDALTGQERWAYVPTAVMPNMYRLADMNYATQHQYFVDGTAEVGDICPNAPSSTCTAAQWRTIIVGGLNQGGNSYYALDITDPSNPSLLWEFTDSTMGQSYSNPRITKLADGTWAVIVASGYNNADGVGRVYVLKASTGALLNTISTATGTPTNPSGLTKLSARAPIGATNNTVGEVYGGDLLGNVWRFDVNGNIGATGTDAQLMVNLQGPSGAAQPITAKPTVASINNTPVIMIGTGRYLGISDLTDTNTFSMYAIKYATSQASTLTTPRATNSKFVQQTLTATTCPSDAPPTLCDQGQSVVRASSNAVDWGVNNGWYIDFVNAGERSVTDPTLALGTLVFTTIKPQTSTTGTITGCTGSDTSVNAQSFLYFLDFTTGGAINGTSNVVGELLCTCVATRPSVVKTQSGKVEAVIRTSGGTSSGTDMGSTVIENVPNNPPGGTLRRTSWRELNGD